MEFVFGSGNIVGTATQDAAGNALAVPQPVKVGVLQDTSCEISFDTKMLYGGNQFPVAVGRGKGKVANKSKFAQVNGIMLNALFFGQTLSSGMMGIVNDQVGTAIPGTPYQITPTVPGSGTWVADLGVLDSNGVPLVKVATGPATGQYSVATGVYTFAAADTTKLVFVNYRYSLTGGKSIIIRNLPMGYAPQFSVDLFMPYAGKQLVLTLNNNVSSKLQFATKLDDFMIPEFDFDSFSDNGNIVGTLSISD